MSWIISLIMGGVVGWLASIIMKTNAQMGLVANLKFLRRAGENSR